MLKRLLIIALLGFTSATSFAGDFDWLESLAVQAKLDKDGLRTKLAARFNLGDVKVKAVIDDLGNAADAYVVMRLGEMSGKDIDYVARRYKAEKQYGWGRLAKSLGIKPGSREFKALKRGHDLNLDGDREMDRDRNSDSMHKDKGKKDKGNGKDKNKSHGEGKGNKNWK